jgi:dihydroflavonol-4-reductase
VKVLVTGATGFVGQKLVAGLTGKGHTVTTLVRDARKARSLPKGVRLVKGDMLDDASLKKAVAGNDAVIHLAAYFDFYPRDVNLLYRVNVDGTRSLLNACLETSVRRFIYCSTTEVIGPVQHPPGNENTELRPQFDYSKSKVMAEEAVREVAGKGGLEHVILRPTGIIGEGDFYTGFETIEAVNDQKIPVTPGDGKKHIMYIHVDDVVTGMLAALTSKPAANSTLILSPDAGMSYNELFKYLGERLGVEPPKRKVPTALAKLGIGLMSPFKNRHKTTFLWHMKTVQAMDEERTYSNRKAKRLLAWSPKLTMREGLSRVIDWYFAHGYLKRH